MTRSCLLIWCMILVLCLHAQASEPILGFRDLQFGMTEQEVSALDVCASSTECLFELTDKNRYVELAYQSEHRILDSESTGTSGLAKITIDMGAYSDAWHQQLQTTLEKNYRLTQDFTEGTKQAFIREQLDELNAGYEDGQVVLQIVRRKFGNLVIKLIYQNKRLATNFVQAPNPTPLSPN